MKLIASVVLASAVLAGNAHATEYQVTNLPSLGGTVSRGNSINNRVPGHADSLAA